MTRYPHFTFPNLFLLNGYREIETHDGLVLEYEQEDALEQFIRHLVVRKPERLKGWDLRFLRRGLGLSQADLGVQVDRDAQTIARWEKSNEAIPSAVDLTIRIRFAARFEPQMSTKEIVAYVDGKGPKLATSIYLRLTIDGWRIEPEPKVKFARGNADSDVLVHVNPIPRFGYRLIEHFTRENSGNFVIEPMHGGKLLVAQTELNKSIADAVTKESTRANMGMLKLNTKGSANENASATIY